MVDEFDAANVIQRRGQTQISIFITEFFRIGFSWPKARFMDTVYAGTHS